MADKLMTKTVFKTFIDNYYKKALNGKANTVHTHDDRYYTESESNGRFQALSNAPRFGTFTLPLSGWSGTSQSKTGLSRITASNCVIVGPAPSSLEAWQASGVRCTAQASGSLSFSCDSTPTADLQVVYAIVSLGV